ncbi:hypothetical protein ACFYT4_01070 [Streptomyces sp. NPDC004609]|uniref:hypothetical protein n=1 Tax=Streptomyces sp. NPDC004609 TaxID=3364704 RepID=UPI0036B90ED3
MAPRVPKAELAPEPGDIVIEQLPEPVEVMRHDPAVAIPLAARPDRSGVTSTA